MYVCCILNILVQDVRERYHEIKSNTQNPPMHAYLDKRYGVLKLPMQMDKNDELKI